jgi:pseudo-rSAM protein
MNEMKKKLILNASTFIWKMKSRYLLYNTEEHTYLSGEMDSLIQNVCDQWLNIDNLYVAIVDDSITFPSFSSFVQKVQDLGLGYLRDVSSREMEIPPVLKIKHGIRDLHLWGGAIEEQPLLHYIKILRLIPCGVDDGYINDCYDYSLKRNSVQLKEDSFFNFLSRFDLSSLSRIIIRLPEWDTNSISSYSKGLFEVKNKVSFVFANPNPGFNNDILDKLVADGFAITQVCPPDSSITKANWVEGRNYQLLVRSDEEVEHWEKLLGENPSVKYDFKPIADNNLEFFRKNVFLSEEEILSQKLSKKDIFRHQALNVNNFGTFYIFPDGTIHPAPDAPAIGTLEDSVHQTIIRELEENHAWRQTRRLMEPCKNCIYHDLCPSPSVYERFFGVPGCTYWKEDNKE